MKRPRDEKEQCFFLNAFHVVDVQETIFTFLDASDLITGVSVCKSWHDILQYAHTWTIEGYCKKHVTSMLNRMPQLLSLTISNPPNGTLFHISHGNLSSLTIRSRRYFEFYWFAIPKLSILTLHCTDGFNVTRHTKYYRPLVIEQLRVLSSKDACLDIRTLSQAIQVLRLKKSKLYSPVLSDEHVDLLHLSYLRVMEVKQLSYHCCVYIHSNSVTFLRIELSLENRLYLMHLPNIEIVWLTANSTFFDGALLNDLKQHCPKLTHIISEAVNFSLSDIAYHFRDRPKVIISHPDLLNDTSWLSNKWWTKTKQGTIITF